MELRHFLVRAHSGARAHGAQEILGGPAGRGAHRRARKYHEHQGESGPKMAKWSCVISSFERIPELVRMALRKSWEGRPGVVHIDVPENIMNTKVKADPRWRNGAASFPRSSAFRSSCAWRSGNPGRAGRAWCTSTCPKIS